MAKYLNDPQPTEEDPNLAPGAAEWLYGTLDQVSAQDDRRRRRRFPFWTALFLLLGVALVAALLWLLLGPSPLATLASRPTSTATPLFGAPLPDAEQQTPLLGTRYPTATVTVTPTIIYPFQIGDRVLITGTGNRGLRLRAGPGLDYITLDIYQDNDVFFVMPGSESDAAYPVQIDGYTWWRLRSPDGLLGWTVEGFLVAAPLLPQTPTPTATAVTP